MSLKIIQNGTPVEATKIWIGGEIQAECLRVWSTEANAWVYEALAEATGTLPLTFRSNGTALIDYRIYGNTLTTKLNLWEWGNTNYRVDLTTPIAANTTLTYAVFKDGIADRAEGIYLYDVNGSRILNAVCANTDGSRIYATVTPTMDVHRIELSPMAADALRMLIEGDTPPDEYISPETTEVQGVGVRTGNLFDPNAAETSGNNIISDFMPLDPSELVLTMAFDIPLRASYNYEIAYYDSTKTAISFVGGMGEAYKTRETVKFNRKSEAPNAAYVKVTLPKDLTNVLIQNGSTSGEYIPYGYKMTLASRTENLYNKNDPDIVYSAYMDVYGNIYSGGYGDAVKVSGYIPINGGKTFIGTDLMDSGSGNYYSYYDANKQRVSGGTVSNNMVFNSPINAAYIRTTLIHRKSEDIAMITDGSTAPDSYIPYYRTETPIYIGDTQLMQDEYVSYGEQAIYKRMIPENTDNTVVYGFRLNPDESDPADAVTYLEDAVGMTPAAMGSAAFNYGSWTNAFFMPKPCMLKFDGTVDYYLDPNDYSKKLDGTDSDYNNLAYEGNAMMEWPLIWYKFEAGAAKGEGYFYVSNKKVDDSYQCWCNYDCQNHIIDHFYTAIYNGCTYDGKMRSISGLQLTPWRTTAYSASATYAVGAKVNYQGKMYRCTTAVETAEAFDPDKWEQFAFNGQTTGQEEIAQAMACNTTSDTEWYIDLWADRTLITGLLYLMGKSLNLQSAFGRGLDSGSQAAKEAYVTGALDDKGLFWGVTTNGKNGVKVFGMENFWGCEWHRTAGLFGISTGYAYKLTHGAADGSTATAFGTTSAGYNTAAVTKPASGYVTKMLFGKNGMLPIATGGSTSTYECDYYYNGSDFALVGGSFYDGPACGFYVSLNYAVGNRHWGVAAAPSCKPLAKLIPIDPPVPLPQLPTFSDAETVLDYEETPAPEKVWVKYHKK